MKNNNNKIIILLLLLFFIIFIFYLTTQTNSNKDLYEKMKIIYDSKEDEYNNRTKKKIAIITSIYGGYDILKEQKINDRKSVDWYCFTDKDLSKNKGWVIITKPYHTEEFNEYYNKLKKQNIKHYNMMSAKYYKIKSHNIDILQSYDYYIWIDGSIFLQKNFIKNINKIIDKNENDVINFEHSARNNLKSEYLHSINMSKYKHIDFYKQYNEYIKNGFPDNVGLFENTIIIRKNKKEINDAYDSWFEENMKHGFQDQISLPYIYWKYDINPYLINENVFNNKLYSYVDYSMNKNH
jgi:hypothetical protein